MQNKKTTIVGYLALAGAVIVCVTTLLQGGDLGAAITNALLPALAGIGFVAGADGGH